MLWLSVLILAISLGLIMIMQEVPVVTTTKDNNGLISEDYNILDLNAPALVGLPLTIFSYIATKSILRPFIIRHLMNDNGVHKIRQLAGKLDPIPPTYYPMTRLSPEEYDVHVQGAKDSSVKSVMTKGLPPKTTSSSMYRSVMDYHGLYKTGKATPSMVLQKVIEGCTKLEHLHMWSSLIPKDVLSQAADSTARWKAGSQLSIWDGVPIAVKDMMYARGHPLCLGMQACSEPAAHDDPVIGRFRELGAIILGMTVMTEAGVTPLGYSLWFDGPFNPYNIDYYPGGSSSASAVVVAAGLVPVAVGYDGGGSIRVPAAMSGTIGLASTFGRVATDGGLDFSVVKSGPLAATVQDAALAHLVMGHVNPSHFYSQLYGSAALPPPPHIAGLDDSVKGMRLGIYWDHFSHSDPEVVQACVQAVDFLKQQGAVVVNVTIPHLSEIHLSHGIKILSEMAQIVESGFYDPKVTFEANTDVTVAMGLEVTAVEVLAAEKIRTFALDVVRNKIFRDLQIDAIVSPTLGLKVPKPAAGYRKTGECNPPLVYKVMRYVPLANFLGLPGLTIPVAYEKEMGLPIGFQLLGDAWMEHKLLRIASAIEAHHVKRRAPPSENYFDPLDEWL